LKIQEAEAELQEVRDAVGHIWHTIEGGKPMSAALHEAPSVFSAGVVALCRAGEHGGVLDVVAERIAKGLESGALALSAAQDTGGKEKPAAVQAGEGPSAVDRVATLLKDAVLKRASDIHLEPTDDGGQVRLRVDGVLGEFGTLDTDAYEAAVTRLMIMADLDIAERRRPQDGRIRVSIANKELDLRCSMMPYVTSAGRKGSMVIRILDTSKPVLELERICEGEVLDTMREWARRPNGIHVVSGPTGSGKTTMLYSILMAANTPERKVLSVENPVEYLLPGVLQAEVRANIGCTFPVLIRSQLRQDPDVLMIGEIQNRDTALLLPAISLTGHLVLTTLHTETATEIPRRLIDIGVEPWLVKDCLAGALSMRLVRKVCPDCRKEYEPVSLDVLNGLPDETSLRSAGFVRGGGCDRCGKTGYRGRIAVYEVLPMTSETRTMVGANASPSELRKAAIEAGMVTMRHDGCRKAAAGTTTLEEVARVTYGMT
jgi:type II secretory ATPase GspE/PulE/Tfp pilus assembly ATPase PilB-like protein